MKKSVQHWIMASLLFAGFGEYFNQHGQESGGEDADEILKKAKEEYRNRVPREKSNVGQKPKRKRKSTIRTEYFKTHYTVNGIRREYSDKVKSKQS